MKISIRTIFLAFVFLNILLSGCAPASTPVPPTLTPTKLPITTSTSTAGATIYQHPYSTTVQIETSSNLTKTVELNYLLYLPSDYGKDPQQKWPLILYLHGGGGVGSNPETLKRDALPKILDKKSDFPFIVVSPQLPPEAENAWWDLIDPVKSLVDNIQATYSVDSQRVYLTGYSLGGWGTWMFALRYPRRFAAIVPIAGFYRDSEGNAIPKNICDLKDLPVWVFHGARDSQVPPNENEVMVDALKACGGNVKFTLYPDTFHDGMGTRTFADPELYKWLLEQRLR